MSENLFKKEDGDLSLKPVTYDSSNTPVDNSNDFIKTVAGFSKEDGEKDPTLFIIISGGEKRERDYFSLLENGKISQRVRVKFIDKNEKKEGGLSPEKMFNLALKVKSVYDKSKGDDLSDHIYLVSDVDHFRNELLSIKPICDKNGLQLIISNSCFEIWLYYGKRNIKPSNFIISKNILKISSEFKTYLGKEVKGGVNPRKAIFDVEKAMINAKKNYAEDNEGIPCLFSTQMYRLMQDILPFIKEELDEIRHKNHRREEKYRH